MTMSPWCYWSAIIYIAVKVVVFGPTFLSVIGLVK